MSINNDRSQPWSTKTKLLGFGLLVLLTLALRFHHLDYESLFVDEIRQVSYYPHSFSQIVLDAASQQQPPLDYWIGHIAARISSTDFALRIPPALFGTGAIVLLVWVLLPVTGAPTAYFTGLIASLLPFNIYYSQEARPYAIAIFFTLLTLLVLDRALKTTSRVLPNVIMLFLGATAYLYSRAYTPLLVIVSLVFVLFLRFFYLWRAEGALLTVGQKRIIFAVLAFGAAILVCLPVMQGIMKMGQRYAQRVSRPLLETFLSGFSRFSLRPLWEAYLTQADPIGFLLLPLILVSPLFLFLAQWRRSFLLFGVTLLLPVAALLDCYIFPSMSDFPFRPPYPVYMLPLCLFLGSAVYNELWESTRIPAKGGRLWRGALMMWAMAALLLTSHATLAFKETRKHEDWRGLAQYLTQNAGPGQILIFDAVTPHGNWEPVFYGFPRYYQGKSAALPLSKLPTVVGQMLPLRTEPWAVLFVYRNFMLTPGSPYPVMPTPEDVKIELAPISHDPELAAQAFTSFLVVRLKSPSGNTATDSLKLSRLILGHLKEDSSTVHIHLAAGSLARALGEDGRGEEHLNLALKLTPPQHQAAVAQTVEAIRTGLQGK
jgi:4-amino-4-deoxy-L-arabinose transferase-like glycosyltransferase